MAVIRGSNSYRCGRSCRLNCLFFVWSWLRAFFKCCSSSSSEVWPLVITLFICWASASRYVTGKLAQPASRHRNTAAICRVGSYLTSYNDVNSDAVTFSSTEQWLTLKYSCSMQFTCRRCAADICRCRPLPTVNRILCSWSDVNVLRGSWLMVPRGCRRVIWRGNRVIAQCQLLPNQNIHNAACWSSSSRDCISRFHCRFEECPISAASG